MAKSTVQIALKVPSGVKVPRSVLSQASKAAQGVIDSQIEFVALSSELAAKGISISADELAKRARRGGRPAPATSTGKRKRVVLTAAQRKSAIGDLKGGATIKSVAAKYGCSPQTVMSIKKGAGLVQKKKAARKRTAKKRK